MGEKTVAEGAASEPVRVARERADRLHGDLDARVTQLFHGQGPRRTGRHILSDPHRRATGSYIAQLAGSAAQPAPEAYEVAHKNAVRKTVSAPIATAGAWMPRAYVIPRRGRSSASRMK